MKPSRGWGTRYFGRWGAKGKYRDLSTARRTGRLSAASVEMTFSGVRRKKAVSLCGEVKEGGLAALDTPPCDDEAVARMGHPVPGDLRHWHFVPGLRGETWGTRGPESGARC
jgi:hypothetical protein